MQDARQVVILAGGLGTRLKPLTDNIPKPLVPVAGRPFLEWQLEFFRRQGFSKFLFLVSYRANQIIDFFGDGGKWNVSIEYSTEPEPLGTGGALFLAKSKLESAFFLVNGDSFLPIELKKMQAVALKSSEAKAYISVYDNNPPTSVPNNLRLESNGDNFRVLEYVKQAGIERGFGYVDSGVYLLDKSLFESAPAKVYQLEALWPALIASKRLFAYECKNRFFDIGTLERLKEFEGRIGDYFTNAI